MMIGFIEVTFKDDHSPIYLALSEIKAVYPDEGGAFIVTRSEGSDVGIPVAENYIEVKRLINSAI